MRRESFSTRPLALLLLLVAAAPGAAPATAACPADRSAVARTPRGPGAPVLCVVQERAFREGVFLIVDARAENIGPTSLDRIEVTVELDSYFGELLTHGTAPLAPPRLEPGHEGALRVVLLFRDGGRRLRYRFTWLEDGRQQQAILERPLTIH
jgi:hypothetical protein